MSKMKRLEVKMIHFTKWTHLSGHRKYCIPQSRSINNPTTNRYTCLRLSLFYYSNCEHLCKISHKGTDDPLIFVREKKKFPYFISHNANNCFPRPPQIQSLSHSSDKQLPLFTEPRERSSARPA